MEIDMNDEIKMSVSSMTGTKDKKSLYVMFQDSTRMAEFELPEYKVVYNKGFSNEELNLLKDYAKNQTDHIHKLSKNINPINAMMKDRQ